MWVGIELYSNVGKCLKLYYFPLLSLIFTYYLRVFFKSFIEGSRSLNMAKLVIINNATYMLMHSVPLFS